APAPSSPRFPPARWPVLEQFCPNSRSSLCWSRPPHGRGCQDVFEKRCFRSSDGLGTADTIVKVRPSYAFDLAIWPKGVELRSSAERGLSMRRASPTWFVLLLAL